MTTKDFDKLGNECIDHLTALNPKGGIKVFVRMAVEFGYKSAVKNLTIPRVTNRFSYKSFMAGLMVGGIIVLLMLQMIL